MGGACATWSSVIRLPVRTCLQTVSLLLLVACNPDVRTFDLTLRTVRSCHPAGLIPQLCQDPSEFAGKTRTAVFTLEMQGPTDFVLYDDQGRAIPGTVQRGGYFARGISTSITPEGCAKTVERQIKFELTQDYLPDMPRLHEHQRTRMKGTAQDRANQSDQCGQATQSKTEEAFEGLETTRPWTDSVQAGIQSRWSAP